MAAGLLACHFPCIRAHMMGLADGGRTSSSSDAVAQASKLMHHGKLNQARYVAAHEVPAGPRYGASSCGACRSMVWSSQRRLGHNPRHCSGTEGSGWGTAVRVRPRKFPLLRTTRCSIQGLRAGKDAQAIGDQETRCQRLLAHPSSTRPR